MYLILGKKVKFDRGGSEYAVAMATPVDPNSVDPSSVRHSIGMEEEFEVVNNRRSPKPEPLSNLPPPPSPTSPRVSRRIETPEVGRDRSPSIDRLAMHKDPDTIDKVL